jgi:hypothetical protein
MRQRRTHQVQDTRKVDVDRGAPYVVRHIAGRAAEPDARIRDHDIDATEGPQGLVDGRVRMGRVARIARHGEASDLSREGLDRFRTTTRHRDPRPLGCETPGDRGADAGAAAADDRHLALEPHRTSRRCRVV